MQLGGGIYKTEVFNQIGINGVNLPGGGDSQLDQSFGYIYTHINPLENLKTTVGLAYDDYNDSATTSRLNISQLSPKFGLQWQVFKFINLRMAGFQSVRAPIINNQTLQPSQIAGFNQFFDDFNGTRTTQYGLGLDVNPTNNIFGGAEAYVRDLKTQFIVDNQSSIFKRKEELYRFYINWLPYDNWVISSELRFEKFKGPAVDNVKSLETAYIPLNVRFYDASGFFFDIGGQFVHQIAKKTSESSSENVNSDFFLFDASVGYRLPKQYGMISLEGKNLLDKKFKYRDRSFIMNEVRSTDLIPERLLFVRISLNF